MKLTRSKLKGIVKECLVEILAEGIDTKVRTQSPDKNRKQNQVQEEI